MAKLLLVAQRVETEQFNANVFFRYGPFYRRGRIYAARFISVWCFSRPS